MAVRKADIKDWPNVLYMGRMMHAEGRFSGWTFDSVRARDAFVSSLELPGWLALISEIDGQPAGFFLGCIVPHFFSTTHFAGDLAWYMLPAYRGRRDGLVMLDMWEKHAESLGVREIKMTLSVGIVNDKVANILERRGYELLETTYVKRY